MINKFLISVVLLFVQQQIFAQRGTSMSRPIQVQEINTYISQSKEQKELSLADILNMINNNQRIPELKPSRSIITKTTVANEKVKNKPSLEIIETKQKVINEQNNLTLEISDEPVTSMSLFGKTFNELSETEKVILKNKQIEYFSKKKQNKKEVKPIMQNTVKPNKPITSMSLFGKTYNELSNSEKEILKLKKKAQTNN